MSTDFWLGFLTAWCSLNFISNIAIGFYIWHNIRKDAP